MRFVRQSRVVVRTFFRRLVFVMAAAMLAFAGLVLFVDGHVPASVPSDAPPYAVTDLAEVLRAVDARGQVDLAVLKANHARLDTFIASMAATSPETNPERFELVEGRVAYWLNAYHALVLKELLDTRAHVTSRRSEYFDAVPIGGKYLTRAAIFRHYLSQSGDARMFLSVFTGAKGRGVPDGAPFAVETLNPQLDDAVRRFVQRKDHVVIEATTVKLSQLFERHRDDFLAALPEERKNVLQIVWAYLPEVCDEANPGCETRADLDRACGNRFDRCQVVFTPIDETLAVKN